MQPAALSTPLSPSELEQLAALLAGLNRADVMRLEQLDGFLCALVAAPTFALPSEFLPHIWGGRSDEESGFATRADAEAAVQLILRHWNTIARTLEHERVYEPLFGEPDEHNLVGRHWARGFMQGVRLGDHRWVELLADENEGQLAAIPLVAGEIDPTFPSKPLLPEKSEQLQLWMGAGLARAYWHFASARRHPARTGAATPFRRAEVKIGRNDPCSCGSGRKYKHCCGAAGGTTH